MEIRNAHQLAYLADCASPDNAGEGDEAPSAGASFLLSVQDEILDAHEYDPWTANACDVFEIADQLVPIYTHDLWETFADLAAYREDVTDFGPIETMEKGAQVALYMIAERLASALVAELIEEGDEEE